MLTQCHVNVGALSQNMACLRRQLEPGVLLAPCVKGNGYGHGLVVAALAFLEGGADWLCVNAVYEAQALREAGIEVPLYVFGFVGMFQAR